MFKNMSFVQKSFLQHTKIFEQVDSETLIVKEVCGKVVNEYPIRFDGIEKYYRRHKDIASDWVFGAVFFGVLSLVFVYPFIISKEYMPFWYIGTFCFISLLGLCIVFAIKNSYDCVVYKNMFSSFDLILYMNKPNKKEFSEFTSWISSKIETSHKVFDKHKALKASEEIFRLSNLLEQGNISKEEYVQLKNEILGKDEDTASMGDNVFH